MNRLYPAATQSLGLGPVRPRSALIVLAVLWAVYLGALWPWMARWGAGDAERAMALPGVVEERHRAPHSAI